MANLQQILDRAKVQAFGINNDPNNSIVIDSDLTAEAIFPHAVRAVYMNLARSGEDLQNINAAHVIAMVSGVGTLPDTVLREMIMEANLPNHPFATFLQHFGDYQRHRFDSQLCYFTIRGDKFYSSCTPDGAGNIVIETPTIPATPVDADDDLPFSEKVILDVINSIASVLRGETTLASLMG